MHFSLLVLALAVFACVAYSRNTTNSWGSFWHITDVHAQPEYKIGSSVTHNCIKGKGRASEYGSLGPCDTTVTVIEHTFKYMEDFFDSPDFIIYTGDWVPQESVNPMNQFDVVNYQKAVASYFSTHFPGIRVFPVLGDIDTLPKQQMYPGPYWLYEEAANAWSDLIRDTIATNMFSAGGYYDTLIAPGLRLLALNTAIYNNKNAAIDYSMHDPLGQFVYITAVLDQARLEDEKVIVIYHIPPGYVDAVDCQMQLKFHDRFVHAFDGYHDLIIGHFAGHSHKDLIRFFGDVQTSDPSKTSVVFVAPSVDPRDRAQTRIRQFWYDIDTLVLQDYTQFVADIHKANRDHAITFTEQYSAQVSYQLPDLSIENMLDFWTKLSEGGNKVLLNEYLSHILDDSLGAIACSQFDYCRRFSICSMGYVEISDIMWCMFEI